LSDATGLFDYPAQLKIYRYMARTRQLKRAQIKQWMNAYTYAGHGKLELSDIQLFETHHGPTSQSQFWKARTYQESGQLETLRRLWPDYTGPKDQETLLWFARAFWLNRQYSQALQVLKNVPPDADSAYWSVRVDLALRSGDLRETRIALTHLKAIEPLDDYLEEKYQRLKFSRPQDRPAYLTYLWQQPPSDHNFYQISRLGLELNDQKSLDRLTQMLPADCQSALLTETWINLAQSYISREAYPQAKQALDRASACDDETETHNDNIDINRGWLALASRDTDTARRLLQQYATQPANARWSPLLASLAIETQRYRLAYHHLKWLLTQTPNDLALLVNLSRVAEGLGRFDDVYRLNRYLLHHLPRTESAFRSLLADWAGDTRAFYALRDTTPMPTLAPTFPGVSQANWWLHRNAARHLTSWQQLQLAMHDGNMETIMSLLNHQALSATDEVSSWLYLQQPAQAMARWYDLFDQTASPTELDLARTARPYYFRAIELEAAPAAGLNSHTQTLGLYFPLVGGQWKFTTGMQDNFRNDGLKLSLQGSFRLPRWQLDTGLDHHAGQRTDRTGFVLDAGYQWDARTQFGLSLALDTESRQNEALLAFGQQRRYSLWGQYQPDSRQQLRLSVTHLTLSFRDGPQLTHGEQYDARYQYQLLQDRPGWTAYTSATWQEFDPVAGVPLPEFPDQTVSVEPFRRFAIGSQFGPAAELSPPYLGVQPAWSVDISLGYQPRTDQMDLTLASGIGWSLLGDDLFKLQLGYQTSDRVGNEDIQVLLGYYRHF
jgi:thioredoxin-like negative regulator of GroEL